MKQEIKVLRVSKDTDPLTLKTAIAGYLRSYGSVRLDTVGVAANYVATKAVILARAALAAEGTGILAEPAFFKAVIDKPRAEDASEVGNIKTGIKWIIKTA